MPKLNQFGLPEQFGCPGCNGEFIRTRGWSAVKAHMHDCCPHFFEGEYTNGELRNKICKLGHPLCMVPGHSFAIYEARRLAEKEAKDAAKQAELEKPRWDVHDEKMKGGYYTRSNLCPDDFPDLVKIVEAELKEYPNGPYGIDDAIGSREDWIDWCLQLSRNLIRVSMFFEEYQNDVSMHIQTLDKLADAPNIDYPTGSEEYVQVLHCIFHETFRRCHLPSPPLLNLQRGMANVGNDGSINKIRMKAFRGYKIQTFSLIEKILDNPISISDVNLPESNLPDIEPVKERRHFKFSNTGTYRYY